MLPGALKGRPNAEVRMIETLTPDRGSLVVGRSFDIPVNVIGIADAALSTKTMGTQAERALDGLRKLAGSKAVITGSTNEGWKVVGIGRSLPADIGPLFVLDASARLTARYNDLSPFGMTAVKLEPALVSYDALTIHWWNRGAGKTALSDKGERTAVHTAIADLANSKPTERFLIVASKSLVPVASDGQASLPTDLERLITDPARVSVTTWGRHLSTNEYRNVPNVVIVGSYDYDQSAYEALTLAATGIWTGAITVEQRKQRAAEEFMHNLYQAVCRGNARNQENAICGKMNAYLIMNDHNERRGLVARAFPGCTIEDWTPVAPKKVRKNDFVLEVLLRLMETRNRVSFQELREVCGQSDCRSYLDKPKNDKRFLDSLRKNGIRIELKSFVRASTYKLVD